MRVNGRESGRGYERNVRIRSVSSSLAYALWVRPRVLDCVHQSGCTEVRRGWMVWEQRANLINVWLWMCIWIYCITKSRWKVNKCWARNKSNGGYVGLERYLYVYVCWWLRMDECIAGNEHGWSQHRRAITHSRSRRAAEATKKRKNDFVDDGDAGEEEEEYSNEKQMNLMWFSF